MSQVEQLCQTVIFYFQQARNPDNETISKATEWLQNFYQQRESLIVLTTILRTCPEEIFRQHAAVALKASLANNWSDLIPQEQDSVFQLLLNVVMSDNSEIVKDSVISLMLKIMSARFLGPVLSLIQSNIENLDSLNSLLEVSLLLCHAEVAENQCVHNIMMGILSQALNFPNIHTNILAVRVMIEALKYKIIIKITFFWPRLLELFDLCITDINSLTALTSLFNTLIDDHKNVIDCPSLTEKVLSFFYHKDVYNDNISLPLFSIIDTLVSTFVDYFVENQLFLHVIHIALHLIFKFFDPLDLSKTQFFESIMRNLVQTENSRFVLSLLWQICCQVVSSDVGKFAVISTIKAVAEQSGTFFDDKINDVINLITFCLASNYEAFQVTAAKTICEFQKIFLRARDPSLIMLAKQLLSVIQRNPSFEFLKPFAKLLKVIPDTTDIFDESFTILIQLIHSAPISLEPYSLMCLAALIDHSPSKTTEYVSPIVEVIRTVLTAQNPDCSILKPPTIKVLKNLLKSQYRMLVSDSRELLMFLSNSLRNPDPKYVIGALQVLKTVFELYPDASIEWSAVDLQYLIHLSSQDWSNEFRDQCRITGDNISEDSIPFVLLFKTTYLALHVISLACIMNKELCTNYGSQILSIASIQTRGLIPERIADACIAIANVARGLCKYGLINEEITEQIVETLISVIHSPVEDNSTQAASDALRVLIVDLNLTLKPDSIHKIIDALLPVILNDNEPSSILLIASILIKSNNPQLLLQLANLFIANNFFHPLFCFCISELFLTSYSSLDKTIKMAILDFVMNKVAQNCNSQFFSLLFIAKSSMEDPAPMSQRMFEILYESLHPDTIRDGSAESFLFKIYDPQNIVPFTNNIYRALNQDGDYAAALQSFQQLSSGNEQLIRLTLDIMLSGDSSEFLDTLKALLNNYINDNSQQFFELICGDLIQDFYRLLNM